MKGFQRRIDLEGLNLERLLRAAADQGVGLAGVRRIGPRHVSVLIHESEIPAMMILAQAGGWCLRKGERIGVGRIRELAGRRWLLLAAMFATVGVIWACTQIAWHIDLVDAGTYEADIRLALDEMNIQAPMLRRNIDISEMRDTLEWRYPRIAWIECGWRGMSLVIRVVEGVMPNDRVDSGPCDVVASMDGVVKNMVTRAGTPVVQSGDLVRKGDILIRGEERTAAGEVRPVAARGTVIARVWERVSVSMPLYETQTTYTGKEQLVWTVRSPWFDLWKMENSGFMQQDISVWEMPLGGFFLPLTLHAERRMEAECSLVLRDQASVKEACAQAALHKLYEKAGGKEYLVDNWVNWSIIEDEILLSEAAGEMLVDIAQQERDSVMAAAE